MSNRTKDEMNDWIADHDDEVIERYLDGMKDGDFSSLVCDLMLEDKVFKMAVYEAIAKSKHMDKAQDEYLATMENEGPEREEYEDR